MVPKVSQIAKSLPPMQQPVLEQAKAEKVRLSEEEYQRLMGKREPKKNKYNAVTVERGGMKMKSKKQAKRFDELVLLRETGEVLYFLYEVPFRMPGTTYWADFVPVWADGRVTVEDVKGFKTDTYKLKKRMMAIHYPHVTIEEL